MSQEDEYRDSTSGENLDNFLRGVGIFGEDPDNNPHPHHSNHRNPSPKIPLSCLVIERCLHPEPYTENSSDKCKYPEVFFGYSPPLVYGFEFVYPHDCVGKEIDDEEKI